MKSFLYNNVMMDNTLKDGKVYKVSIQKPQEYQVNDIVVYEYYDAFLRRDLTSVGRIIGLPGDTIEISNSMIFRNGKLLRLPVSAMYYYTVVFNNPDQSLISRYSMKLYSGNIYHAFLSNIDSMTIVNRHNETVKHINKAKFPLNPAVLLSLTNSFQWELDNFGPVIVPERGTTLAGEKVESFINGFVGEKKDLIIDSEYFFTIGGNFHNCASDSRYGGFINFNRLYGKLEEN